MGFRARWVLILAAMSLPFLDGHLMSAIWNLSGGGKAVSYLNILIGSLAMATAIFIIQCSWDKERQPEGNLIWAALRYFVWFTVLWLPTGVSTGMYTLPGFMAWGFFDLPLHQLYRDVGPLVPYPDGWDFLINVAWLCATAYVLCRLMLILPAVATGERGIRMPIRAAWRRSRGIGGPLVVGCIIISVAAFLLNVFTVDLFRNNMVTAQFGFVFGERSPLSKEVKTLVLNIIQVFRDAFFMVMITVAFHNNSETFESRTENNAPATP